MKYWKHVESKREDVEEWRKGDMRIAMGPASMCICPIEDCEDYFERTDIMPMTIFHYSLIGIALGIKQGRKSVWNNFDRDEALWMLGWFGIIPTQKEVPYDNQ